MEESQPGKEEGVLRKGKGNFFLRDEGDECFNEGERENSKEGWDVEEGDSTAGRSESAGWEGVVPEIRCRGFHLRCSCTACLETLV